MPWRGPEIPSEFPTLGYEVANWVESRCAIPDRELVGQPFLLTDEQLRFLLHFYRLDLSGSFVHYRGAQLTRPQKWGKGPLAAAVICAEAQGPVRFDGWDSAGEPVGRPVPTPLIQVTAVSEDQTENVYSALLPMIELGALHGEIDDTGLGRINLPGGGKIEPVTASGRSRLGQRLTFAVQDQTESWLQSNGGRVLADNQRRNLAGMGEGGRWLSTPNAWDPIEESVAQYTAEHEHEGVFHDDVEPPESLSVGNKSERRRALRVVYGDAVAGTRDGKAKAVRPWIELDRVDAEIGALLERDPAQAERFFLNRKRAPSARAFDGALWDSRRVVRHVADGSLVVFGVDGARFQDALVVVATEVASGYMWCAGLWERPVDAPDDYEHPFEQVDGVVSELFDRFDVWRGYCDPQMIDNLVDGWAGDYGDKRVVRWYTNRPRQIAHAVRNFHQALTGGDLSHDGDPDLARHVKQAVRRRSSAKDDDGRPMWEIGKDRPGSPRKMDGAMAAVLSWEARGDAIADGGLNPPPTYRPAVGW